MKSLTVMCGLPRGGKSTWVKNNKESEVIISADDLRYIVYNQQFSADGEPLMWAIRGIMLRYLLQQGVDIIIDETNTMVERRKPIIKLAKQYGYEITCVEVTTDKDLCITRAVREGSENLVSVIERMDAQFQHPTLDEGFNWVLKV